MKIQSSFANIYKAIINSIKVHAIYYLRKSLGLIKSTPPEYRLEFTTVKKLELLSSTSILTNDFATLSTVTN